MKRLRSFPLFNHHIKIRYQKRVLYNDKGERLYGDCDINKCLITVVTHDADSKEPFNEEVIFHTTCHEIAHYFAHLSGRPDLYKDEKFIDWFGGLLAQF